VKGSYNNYSNRGGGSMFGHQRQQKSVPQKSNFSEQSYGTVQSHRLGQGGQRDLLLLIGILVVQL
jgi:hypothetical protein